MLTIFLEGLPAQDYGTVVMEQNLTFERAVSKARDFAVHERFVISAMRKMEKPFLNGFFSEKPFRLFFLLPKAAFFFLTWKKPFQT
jgi:hypothetical protein